MIASLTPLRIPLAGGLTDVKAYAGAHGGVTVSAAIDQHVRVELTQAPDGRFELHYGDVREVAASPDGLRHDLTREALRMAGMKGSPVRVRIMVEFAGEGGLGASGAVTVGLLHAMHAHRGSVPPAAELARQAAEIEVERLGGASGYHDPTITALGGIKRIEYRGADAEARRVEMSAATREGFERMMLLFYSGHHAPTKPSLDLLTRHLSEAEPVLHDIKALGYELETAFGRGDLGRVAEIVGEQQALKQRLPGHFVDDYVLEVTDRVRQAGGFAQLPGGKISAFVLVACPDGTHEAVRRALSELEEVPLRLEPEGTRLERT